MAEEAGTTKAKKPLYTDVNLPALLNDPRLARRELDFFTRTWGEAFGTAGVRTKEDTVVRAEEFKRYAKKVLRHLRKINRQRQNRAAGIKDSNQNVTENGLEDDDKIPSVFFLPTFNLENPSVFNAVVQTTDTPTNHNQGNAKPLHSLKLQHERLSHNLDSIESKLAKQISVKFDLLFVMAKFQNNLQENMKDAAMAAHALRQKTKAAEKHSANGPMKMLRLIKTKSAANAVLSKLHLIASLYQTKPTLQLMIETNEFVGALELAQTSKEILVQELQGATCFKYLFSELTEFENRAIDMMEQYFRSCIQSDLQTSGTDASDDTIGQQEDKVYAVITSLLRVGRVEFLALYHEDMCEFLKLIVKQRIVEAVSAAKVESQQGLAEQMRSLNYTQWSDLLGNILDTLFCVYQRAVSFCNLVNSIISKFNSTKEQKQLEEQSVTVQTPAPSSGNVANGKMAAVVYDMLMSISDNMQERCAKVLSARAKDGFLERLPPPNFVVVWQRVTNFSDSCETLADVKCSTLRDAIQHHANQFITRFHDEQRVKLSLILDNERWRQANVPIAFQQLVDYVQSTSQLRLCDIKNDDSALLETQHKEYLVVGGRRFVVVGTALMLLKMIIEYCQLAEDMPSIAWNVLTQLVELVKLFNSRTCQLILGAGAVQMVGLKTISARHLALASSCLQLVVHYLPIVQKFFQSRIEGRQLNIIRYFEQITKDYKDHMGELDNQLVSIISVMIEQCLSTGDLRQGVQNVVKNLVKCHESLGDALPDSQLSTIFTRIHAEFVMCFQHRRSTAISGTLRSGTLGTLGTSTSGTAELLLYMDTLGSLYGLSSVDFSVGIS
jgi:vacuolar protein sorting-associated protein 54